MPLFDSGTRRAFPVARMLSNSSQRTRNSNPLTTAKNMTSVLLEKNKNDKKNSRETVLLNLIDENWFHYLYNGPLKY